MQNNRSALAKHVDYTMPALCLQHARLLYIYSPYDMI